MGTPRQGLGADFKLMMMTYRVVVIPAKAGIQGKGVANGTALTLDSGSPLRCGRNDGAFWQVRCL